MNISKRSKIARFNAWYPFLRSRSSLSIRSIHVLLHFHQTWKEKRFFIDRNRCPRLVHSRITVDRLWSRPDLHGLERISDCVYHPPFPPLPDIITENKGTTMRTKENSQGDREESVFYGDLMHKLIVQQIKREWVSFTSIPLLHGMLIRRRVFPGILGFLASFHVFISDYKMAFPLRVPQLAETYGDEKLEFSACRKLIGYEWPSGFRRFLGSNLRNTWQRIIYSLSHRVFTIYILTKRKTTFYLK